MPQKIQIYNLHTMINKNGSSTLSEGKKANRPAEGKN